MQLVILPLRDMNGGRIAAGYQLVSSCFLSLVVKEHLFGYTAQHYHILARKAMLVNGYHRARLDGIEHTLTFIIGRIAQVVVHTKARGGFGLGGEGVKEGFALTFSLMSFNILITLMFAPP